jgi:putative FmdB family regulatory protein
MPVYTYRCQNCGFRSEFNQKFTDEALTHCPKCHKETLQKVYTPVGIVFKGSGFYATDHKSPSGVHFSGSSAEKTSEDEKSTADKGTESKSEESKPAETKTPESKPVETKPAAETTKTKE